MKRTDFVLGITGGAGCGKSTVLTYLQNAYDAFLIQCDEVARELQQPGQACYAPMIRLLGEEIVRADRTLDRGRIAERVFQEEALLRQLNAIVHPAVKRRVQELIDAYRREGIRKTDSADCGRCHLIAIEAALLLDDGYDAICDEIFYIYASKEERRRRLKESRGYSDARIDSLFASQRSEESFRALCDAVIDNSDPDLSHMYRQMDALLARRIGFV